MNWFRPPLTIVVSPEELRFITKTHDVREPPLARLDARGFLIGVGEDAYDDKQGGYIVNLFRRPDDARDLAWFDEVTCTRVFRYFILLATDSKRIRRPVVKIQGVRRFQSLFNGHEIEISPRVLNKAGAAHVEFVDI